MELNADLAPIKHCILSLVLNLVNQVENTVVCMVRLLSSNADTSSNLNTIHLKISTHAYFTVLFHSTWSEYKNTL